MDRNNHSTLQISLEVKLQTSKEIIRLPARMMRKSKAEKGVYAVRFRTKDGYLCSASVQLKPVDKMKLVDVTPKASGKIVELMRHPPITIPELAGVIGVTGRSVERNIQKLQGDKIIRRVGLAKGGHWEVME